MTTTLADAQKEWQKIKHYPHPYVGVMFTYVCNGACKGCLAGMDTQDAIKDDTFISATTVDRIIDKLTSIPGGFQGRVAITGGEPGLHPDFVKFSQKFADAGLLVRITTNATWIQKDIPFEDQEKLMGLIELAKRPNVRLKLPMDQMHFNAFPKLSGVMARLYPFLDRQGLVYGENYVFAIIASSLSEITQSAHACGLQINESNALGFIRDWRPALQVGELSDVVNFLQVGPEGTVYQNYHQMLARTSLGNINNLDQIVLNMSAKIKSNQGTKLWQADPYGDWVKLAGELIRAYHLFPVPKIKQVAVPFTPIPT